MKGKVYTVHAHRWGDRERHSYLVGVFTKKHAAQRAAEDEEQYRGGKYECEIIEWIQDNTYRDETNGTTKKIIKPLPEINTLIARQKSQ